MLRGPATREDHGGMDVVRAARTWRLSALMLALVTSAALTTACGDDAEPGDLPTLSSSPSATADAESAVEAAYRGYQKATEEIAASGNPNPATLRPYATAERAQKTAEDLSLLIDEGFRIVGTQKIDVRSVTVDGEKAVLEACIDATEWITVKKGETPGPGEKGQAPDLASVDLVQQGGEWLVSGSKDGGQSATRRSRRATSCRRRPSASEVPPATSSTASCRSSPEGPTAEAKRAMGGADVRERGRPRRR